MREWMKVVLPPSWYIGAFAAVYVLVECFSLLLCWAVGPTRFLAGVLHGSPAGGSLLVAASMCYGAFRAVAFSPVFRPGYRKWLGLTPWAAEMPLPLGPVHLVWQDLVVLALLGVLVARHPGVHCLDLVLASGCCYAVLSIVSLLAVGQYRQAIALLFVSACTFMTDLLPAASTFPWVPAIVTGVCLAAGWGVRGSLRGFPWQLEAHEERLSKWTGRAPADLLTVGWPYHSLRPHPSRPVVSTTTGIVVSLMLAWWVFAISVGRHVSDLDAAECWFAYRFAVVLLGIGRGCIYCFGHLPPISLWGRIRTGRLVVPEYDRVFVTPISILLVGHYFPKLVLFCGLPFPVAICLSVLVVVLLTLNLGPSLSHWRLTGAYRMVVPAVGSSDARTSQGIAKI